MGRFEENTIQEGVVGLRPINMVEIDLFHDLVRRICSEGKMEKNIVFH